MDKELRTALENMLNERSQMVGRTMSREQMGSIVLELDAMIAHRIGKIATGQLADCGSFGCPTSYSCDWF